jgi:hypothetical protein
MIERMTRSIGEEGNGGYQCCSIYTYHELAMRLKSSLQGLSIELTGTHILTFNSTLS